MKRQLTAMMVAGLLSTVGCGDMNAVETGEVEQQGLTGYGVQVDCRIVNNFGYVASASGTLSVTGHDWPDGFLLKGKLNVNTKVYGESDHKRTISVNGSGIDVTGKYMSIDVASGASDLQQLNLDFNPGTFDSNIAAFSGIMYQTDCSHSVSNLPPGADLALNHKMRFYSRGDGTIGAQLDVTNIGNIPATAPTGRVKIGNSTVTVALYQYWGGTSTKANTVNPGENGYMLAILPAANLARCKTYNVSIDLDHNMQSGTPSPFTNDSGTVTTPCLKWNTPITEYETNYTPDPIVYGKTLGDIVSSVVVGRKSDGKTCSQCHYAGSGHPYSPPAGTITPTTAVGGRVWSGNAGWGAVFVSQPDTIKPAYLKDLFKIWLSDGGK